MSYARVQRGESLFGRARRTRTQGTPRLFLDTFPTPDGRARFHAIQHQGPAEEPDGHIPSI